MRAQFLLPTFFLLLAHAEAGILDCWPRHASEPLTISRIMRQFRDNLNDAGVPLSQGMADPTRVTDADLERAIAFVGVAVACVDVTLTDEAEEFLPTSAYLLEDDARDAFLQKYFSYMREFRAGLVELTTRIQELRATPASERNFRAAYSQEAAVREIANQAHHHL